MALNVKYYYDTQTNEKSDYNKFQRQFLSSENVNTKTNFSSGLSLSIIDFILTGRFPLSGKRYEEVRNQLDLLSLVPLRIMALLVAVSGLFAMVFEIKYFPLQSGEIYLIRLSSTIIAFVVLAMLTAGISVKRSRALVHLLLLTIIVTSGSEAPRSRFLAGDPQVERLDVDPADARAAVLGQPEGAAAEAAPGVEHRVAARDPGPPPEAAGDGRPTGGGWGITRVFPRR